MSLAPGRDLSHYRIVEPIGEGGMGVVWRATDSTLGRDVAIKVLPDFFAADPERLARFEREARLLASLNHPHIASIFGFHASDGVRFLAMELVEGEDLAQRLRHGAIPVVEALPLALQIAHALEHAHERGVIHRDLKPANVKLTTGGQAKVLDFGLAKALEGDPGRPASSSTLSQSPTITGPMTGVNVILGTAAYMSPEQARGHAADKRADIWAFGVVLFEMLTGSRLFEGETVSDTLAAVLKTEPDWASLPKETPQRVRTLLRRCLDRDPKRRLRDIGEARILLEAVIAGGPDEPVAATPASPARRAPIAAIALGGLVVGALATLAIARIIQGPPPEVPLRKFRLTIPVAEGAVPSSPAISPDGRTVAYLIQDHLWIQSFGELEPKQLTVDPGAAMPFWSPDGRSVGYFAGTRIIKSAMNGDENQAVCDIRGPRVGGQGVCWREDGTLVFSRGDSAGLLQVPALGGDPKPLLRPDTSETDFHEPSALPGDRGLLFCAHRRKGGINNISLWAGGKRKLLLELPDQMISHPVYAPSGHILFQRSPTTPGIWALPFSLDRLEVTGEAFMVVPGGSTPSVSREGTLAFVAGGASAATQLVWVDRDGKEQGVIGQPEPNASMNIALSHDGTRVARALTTNDNRDIWIYDMVRGIKTRLTFDPASEGASCWSPRGDRMAHQAQLSGTAGALGLIILLRSADGTGSADTLASGVSPTFTPDGTHIIYTSLEAGGTMNLTELPLSEPRTPRLILRGNPQVFDGRVAPTGHFMAYMSRESGEWQIFLTRYPSGEGKWQVSVAGGQSPRWNARGDRLYYVQAEDIMEVDVGGTASPTLGVPRRLFTRPSLGASGLLGLYPIFDLTGDGKRFVIVRGAGEKGVTQSVAVVQNWLTEFQGKSAK